MKFHKVLLILILGILLGLLGVGILELIAAKPRGQPIILIPPPTASPLQVYVSGAVQEPGVYTLPSGSIIQDAIAMAGGALPDAPLDSINLAAPIQDGQQIHLTTKASTQIQDTPYSTVSAPTSKMNVNTVNAMELESLPGIGPSLADEIIKFRQTNGPFLSIEDLLKVPGIGPAKLDQIKHLIVIR
jgi:competence protein ComEA